MPMIPPPTIRISVVTVTSPHLPGRLPRIPQLFDIMLFFQGVHAGPDPLVAVSHQLALLRQSLDRLPFPDRFVALNVIDHSGVQNKKPPVDPAFGSLGFFVE